MGHALRRREAVNVSIHAWGRSVVPYIVGAAEKTGSDKIDLSGWIEKPYSESNASAGSCACHVAHQGRVYRHRSKYFAMKIRADPRLDSH